MNILIVTGIFPPEIGGPATYVPEIVSRLSGRHNFRIITFTQDPAKFDGATVISVAQNQTALFQEIIKHLAWCDVIYAQDPLVVGLVSVLCGKIFGKKVVVRYGGDPAWEAAQREGRTKKFLQDFIKNPDGGLKSMADVWLTRLSFSLMDRIITNSEFLKQVVRKGYGINSKKISVIHNAIDPGRAPKKLVKKKIYQVLSLGRLVSWKGNNGVIKAVAEVNKRGKVNVELLIIGNGPEKKDLEKALIGHSARLLPAVSHGEAIKALERADLYVLNSSYEGSPNQVIEAFAAGTPVVATDIPGTNEVAVNNKTALTVKPGDVLELARVIEKILGDPDLANRLVDGGRKILAEEFAWKTVLNQINLVLSK